MADHGLSITDGSTTVEFNSGDQILAKYTPKSGDGILEERALVWFRHASDIETARDEIRKVNRLFEKAALYARHRTGDRVFIYFNPGEADATDYRAEVITGKASIAGSFEAKAWYEVWDERAIPVIVEWTRDGGKGWEGPETAVTGTNENGSSSTGLQVVNHHDGDTGDDNTFEIAAAQIEGDLPTPAIIEMEHTDSGTEKQRGYYIFHNVYSDPSNFDHILEGEDGTGGTSTADANASGGNYAAFSWSSSSANTLSRWTLSGAQLARMDAGYFAILIAMRSLAQSSPPLYLKTKLVTQNQYNVIWEGTWTEVPNSGYLHLIDHIRILPNLFDLSSLEAVELELVALREDTSNSLDLDFIQLSPISTPNGWRHLQYLGLLFGIDFGETLKDDMNDGNLYSVLSSGEKRGDFQGRGGPIMLRPNEVNKFYFLSYGLGSTGQHTISLTHDVVVKYRPRRRTI